MALTVEQLEILGAALADVYQQLERAAIADIARRLRKTERLTETAELMAEALRQKGYSPIAIQRQVMRELNANPYFQQEIAANTLAYKQTLQKQIDAAKESARRVGREVVQEAGNLAFRNDLSMWAQGAKPVKGSAFERLIQATKKALTADLLNLTRTTGFQLPTGAMVSARNAYTRALNLALVKTTSGAYSYRQAIAEAVRELAASGLRTVDYASGVSRQLDTAARNAVMTASAQLAGQITMDNAEQTGVDYVEVSSHCGARTGEGHANHAAWQGKIYRIHGSDEKYGNLERETGYPSDPAGLCGYNCRHTFSPFWPGISEPTQWPKEPEPKEYGGRSYTYYQATQAQRRREREIRALKREVDGMKAAGLTQQARQLEGRIRAMTEEYEDFSAAMEIRPKNERLWVCGDSSVRTFAASYKPLTGHDFDANIDVDVPKDVRKLVDTAGKRVTRDFPMLDDYLYAVGYGENEPGNPATAVLSIRDGYVGQVIVLNRDMWTSAKSMDAFVRDQSERGKHIQAKHADSIITHEYGHVLHNSCALKRVGYTGQGTISEQQIARFALEKKRIADEVQLILENDDLRFDSERAYDKAEELIAEAVSDYYSGNRTKASKLVVDYLKRRFG